MDQKFNSIAQKESLLQCYRIKLVNQIKLTLKLEKENKELKEKLEQLQKAPSYAH